MLAVTSFLRERSPSVITILLLGGTYLIYTVTRRSIRAYRRSIFKKQNGCKPLPSFPHKDPIFGLDFFIEGSKLLKTGKYLPRTGERWNLVDNGARTYSHLVLGERVIVTIEPENIKTILATQFKNFQMPARRVDSLVPLLGHGIFTTDGKEWEDSRNLLRPSFNRSLIGDIEVFERHVSKMISKIPKDESTVDLQKLFFMLTLDSATEFLFGESTDVLGTAESRVKGEKFADCFGYATEFVGTKARLGRLAAIFPDKKYEDSKNFVHEYIQYYVHRTLEQNKASVEKADAGSSKYVFIEHLAKTGNSPKKIQDELLNILLAGRDTTAGLLAHLWYILARRPDVFNKLRTEVLRLDGREPTFEEIKEMKYLQYCLNEALRLYPLVPINGRVAIKDTVLPLGGGPDGKSPIFVKAGTAVNYQVYNMHRRKDLYGEDAEEFRPERWESIRQGWHYLPFNGGPRICIGQQFALTEAGYTTIRLLQAFRSVENRDPNGYGEWLTLTLAVRDGVKVGLTPA